MLLAVSDETYVTLVTIVAGVITLWIQRRYDSNKISDKIDQNTTITKAGSAAAATNAREAADTAKVAANAASHAKIAADTISKKLNGGIDEAINAAITPIKKAIEDHTVSDDNNMREVREKFNELTVYMHTRNHDMLNAINAQSMKVDALLVEIKKGS